MSRRTKLAILSVSLALVCLITVELVLTWSPEAPLRFRITPPPVEKSKTPTHAGTEYVDGYQVEVENATGATIRIVMAHLLGPEESGGDLMDRNPFGDVILAHSGTELDSVIPPYESRRFNLYMFNAKYVAGLSRSEMRYLVSTRSKDGFNDCIEYMAGHGLPLLRRFHADIDEYATPVQMGEQQPIPPMGP